MIFGADTKQNPKLQFSANIVSMGHLWKLADLLEQFVLLQAELHTH